jgi:hypothetical protein
VLPKGSSYVRDAKNREGKQIGSCDAESSAPTDDRLVEKRPLFGRVLSLVLFGSEPNLQALVVSNPALKALFTKIGDLART